MALARSLVHDPPALVLDEPTLGLDVVAAAAVYDFVRQAREEGKAVLLSTHRMEEVQLLADRVGILNRGRLAVEGTPAQIMETLGVADLTEAFLRVVEASL
jgi:ABC-type multidrug transport system ATPase subunit